MIESGQRFSCFGSTCEVRILSATGADGHVASAREALRWWHAHFTRFDPASALSLLNADPRGEVPVSDVMARFAEAALDAADRTGGLVDATLLHEIEDAGYRGDLRTPIPLRLAIRLSRARRPARGGRPLWQAIEVDRERRTIGRPRGLGLDSGGIVKGLAADVLAGTLADSEAFLVDCAGDLRVGGAAGLPREVHVADPFGGGEPRHTFTLTDGAAATSGIGRRSWLDQHGRPGHHLLDPSTGLPAFTGVVQATALAPTALEAEIRAKAAVLSGPRDAARWLPDGGVVVLDDASHIVFERQQPPTPAGSTFSTLRPLAGSVIDHAEQ